MQIGKAHGRHGEPLILVVYLTRTLSFHHHISCNAWNAASGVPYYAMGRPRSLTSRNPSIRGDGVTTLSSDKSVPSASATQGGGVHVLILVGRHLGRHLGRRSLVKFIGEIAIELHHNIVHDVSRGSAVRIDDGGEGDHVRPARALAGENDPKKKRLADLLESCRRRDRAFALPRHHVVLKEHEGDDNDADHNNDHVNDSSKYHFLSMQCKVRGNLDASIDIARCVGHLASE